MLFSNNGFILLNIAVGARPNKDVIYTYTGAVIAQKNRQFVVQQIDSSSEFFDTVGHVTSLSLSLERVKKT